MDIKTYSYLYGLFGTDGNVRRNKTETHIYDITLEIIDKDIVEKIYNVLDNCSKSERLRDTNFKKNYHSYTLSCRDKQFISWCEQNNFPIKNKTLTIGTPLEYSESDFWRGVIDGDGSLGMKKNEQMPYVNLTTASDDLKESYCDYIYKLTGFRPKVNRNKRDNIYNITLHCEKAMVILHSLYKNANIYIDRKYNTYLELCSWKREKAKTRKPWTQREIDDLLKMTNDEFHLKYPERTYVAIRGKRQKLKQQGGVENVNK